MTGEPQEGRVWVCPECFNLRTGNPEPNECWRCKVEQMPYVPESALRESEERYRACQREYEITVRDAERKLSAAKERCEQYVDTISELRLEVRRSESARDDLMLTAGQCAAFDTRIEELEEEVEEVLGRCRRRAERCEQDRAAEIIRRTAEEVERRLAAEARVARLTEGLKQTLDCLNRRDYYGADAAVVSALTDQPEGPTQADWDVYAAGGPHPADQPEGEA